MALREFRRRVQDERIYALKQFQRQKQLNLLAEPGIHPFIIILDHLEPSFNIGKIIRSADAFGAHEVHFIGVSFFDPIPAKGSFKWVPAVFYDHFDNCYQDLIRREYVIYTLEPDAESSLLFEQFPAKTAFVLGNEKTGISFNSRDYSGIRPLKIPQYGKVQSLNVSIAASLVMFEYVRQQGPKIEAEITARHP